MDDQRIGASDYLQWLTPRATIAKLIQAGLPEDDAKQAIENWLERGSLSSVAYRMLTQGFSFQDEIESDFAKLPRAVWGSRDLPDGFWDTGNIKFARLGLGGLGRVTDSPRTCFAVRFDPIGIGILVEFVVDGLAARDDRPAELISSEAPASELSHHSAYPASDDDVRSWYGLLAPEDQARGLRDLWQMARDRMGKRVMRKQVEPFVAGRKRGRRAKAR